MSRSYPFLKTVFAVFAVVILISMSARAEEAKHPRVAEVENLLVKDATSFLKVRFPDMPFLVTVSIDPLRRTEVKKRSDPNERLPYFEEPEEELQDEWDNPNISVYALMARTKKVSVSISVPSHLNDDEVNELKTNLMQALNLNSGRDEVGVNRRTWTKLKERPDSETVILFSSLGFGVIFISLMGLFFVTRSSLKTLGSAMAQQGAKGQSASASSGGGSVGSANVNVENVEAKRSSGAGGGDFKFSDPIRIREVVHQSVKTLLDASAFPNLQDLMIMDRLGKKSPESLGALLTEFPPEKQRQLFSYSFQHHWLQAMAEPGEPNSDVLETLNRLQKIQRGADDVTLQKLLIYVWRLDDQMPAFLRMLEPEESMAILAMLPKTVSVSAARAAFPGNWGAVLDTQFKPKALTKEKVEKLALKAMQLKALRDLSILEQYRHERDLLEYLLVADPQEEKEVYLASPPQSVIHSVRPPFYKVFDMPDEALTLLCARVSLDEWALALFNTARSDRREIEKRFSEKQKFVFIEKLKKLDQNPPDKIRVGQSRERIAKMAKELLANVAQMPEAAGTNSNEEANKDSEAA